MKKVFLSLAALATVALSSVSCNGTDDPGTTVTPNPTENMRVIVAVLDSEGNVLNAQDAKAGVTKDYVMVGTSFQHRVLIEDFTGAWCGWCPRVTFSIENITHSANAEKIVAAALHNGDKLRFSPHEATLSNALWTKFGYATNQRGYPFAVLNRNAVWNAVSGNRMNENQAINLAQTSSPIGIKIESNLGETSGTVNVSFKFNQEYTGLKYVVYVVQDGIVLKQSNYTTNYNGPGTNNEFVHNDVVKATNNVLGVDITSSASGSEFQTGNLEFTYKKF